MENRSPLPLLPALDCLTTWMAPASYRELLVVDTTSHRVQGRDSRASAFRAATTRDGTRNETHLRSHPCRENLCYEQKASPDRYQGRRGKKEISVFRSAHAPFCPPLLLEKKKSICSVAFKYHSYNQETVSVITDL